jgi:iron complex outermembrane receptor protein
MYWRAGIRAIQRESSMQQHFLAAAAAALCLCQSTFATDVTDEAAVIVTATRFTTADPRIPANISVITQQDLAEIPSAALPDILKARAGINVRSIAGGLGDASIDLRGFGETADSNTLILIDGQRINPIDMSSINWSVLPLTSVQRIEIIRGSGTILYGDRASGGVINIITDKSGTPAASVTIGAGNLGFRQMGGHLAGGDGKIYFNLSAQDARQDGWRENNKQEQQNLAGRIGLRLDASDIFADFAVYHNASSLPGSLFSLAYANNPRAASTPWDKQSRNGYRLHPGARFDITTALTLETEIGVDQEDRHGDFPSFDSSYSARKENLSATPRLRWRHDLGSLNSESVAGFDYYRGTVDSCYSVSPRQFARQTSTSLYLQNSTALSDAWTLTLGGRRQRMAQTAHQDDWPAWFQPALDGQATRTLNASDLGISYTHGDWRTYGRAGSTYRFANTDELFGYDSVLFAPKFAGDLRPQHGRIGEIGTAFRARTVGVQLAAYQMNLTDEIGYDAAAGANINFDPTRRRGLEAELDWRPGGGIRMQAAYSHTDARFREGPYSAQNIPLVPKNMATFQIGWNGDAAGAYDVLARYVGSRRYSGDYANQLGQLSGYTLTDLRASWPIKPWTVTARLLNAFDKRHAPFAGYSTFASDYYYYPGDGRTFQLAVRYDFR